MVKSDLKVIILLLWIRLSTLSMMHKICTKVMKAAF
jgi:hypothetical protein